MGKPKSEDGTNGQRESNEVDVADQNKIKPKRDEKSLLVYARNPQQ
ncbi:hypothetical protein [Synechococcus sp. KORDI-52]|nr:hypothetical protein [Synechococcus sp. KORDI-52]